MNAVSNSATDLIEENAGGSDSDSNHEDSPEYYQPISIGEGDLSDQSNSDQNSDEDSDLHPLPNGYARCVENRMSILDLSEDEESEEEEEERIGEASDSAMLRAIREDENRRNAPLTAENATRVMEAMRGISFGGLAPDWADQVPENQWINRLRRLRRPPTTVQD
ncbi:uncharacterized protein LOC132269295 [Cornus florida]|uniref:uncharacterized protein LOC132269295 n=1 Tax=Cornus florida TaxID=4283 RepID=UPI002898F5C9|nr:uncharacterized protein LOC132269295 [Cornus florida]